MPANRPLVAARAQHDELSRLIRDARYRYYVLSDLAMPDAEFDARLHELEAIEERFPELRTPDSPTQQVGSPLDAAFPPFEHLEAMQSLDNVFSEADLRTWSDRVVRGLPEGTPVRWACELKIDGTAINCVYRRGVLAVGATRGTGTVGETVTQQLLTLDDVPYRLADDDPPDVIEIRGEVYYPVAKFNRMNEERIERGEPAFMNPRNAASGALRQKDPGKVRERPARHVGARARPPRGPVVRLLLGVPRLGAAVTAPGARGIHRRGRHRSGVGPHRGLHASAATRSASRSTVSSSRSTTWSSGERSARRRRRRDGPSPTRCRRSSSRRSCGPSRSTSDARARPRPSPCSSPSPSPASRSPTPRSTTRSRCWPRTCASATR